MPKRGTKIKPDDLNFLNLKAMPLNSEFRDFIATTNCEFNPKSWIYHKKSNTYVKITEAPKDNCRKAYELVIHCRDYAEKNVCIYFLDRIRVKLGTKYYSFQLWDDSLDVRILLLAGQKLSEKICTFFFDKEMRRYLENKPIVPGYSNWPPTELAVFY